MLDKKLKVLLKDFGYRYDGKHLIHAEGFYGEYTLGIFKSIFSAADYLIPIIKDEEYFDRFSKIAGYNI